MKKGSSERRKARGGPRTELSFNLESTAIAIPGEQSEAAEVVKDIVRLMMKDIMGLRNTEDVEHPDKNGCVALWTETKWPELVWRKGGGEKNPKNEKYYGTGEWRRFDEVPWSVLLKLESRQVLQAVRKNLIAWLMGEQVPKANVEFSVLHVTFTRECGLGGERALKSTKKQQEWMEMAVCEITLDGQVGGEGVGGHHTEPGPTLSDRYRVCFAIHGRWKSDDCNSSVIEIEQICRQGQTTMRVTVGSNLECVKKAYSEGFGG
jgi:hypothetical protein